MPELSLKECEGCNHREGNIEKKKKEKKTIYTKAV